MSELEQKIKELRSQGLTFKQISEQLKCSKGSICYYLTPGQKDKARNRTYKNRKQNPIATKISYFIRNKPTKPIFQSQASIYNTIKNRIRHFTGETSMPFSVEDVLKKLGDNPTCYLTGEQIDLSKPNTYQFDHIIPRSRGGTNELDNLGLCSKSANRVKSDMTPDELINLCKVILQHQGYTIQK
jgi:5-methylcytosine-specific restriction endonuclease McrA